MPKNNKQTDRNFKFARDRAAVVAAAVVAIIRDWVDEPELRNRIAETLRFEFADIEQQIINENRQDT